MMWPPFTQICATPSQPVFPYFALHTSTWPVVGLQFLGFVFPATTAVSNTLDWLQSEDASCRYASEARETLSPSFKVNGFAIRAQ